MFNFFKTGGKGPADSDAKEPGEEVRTEPVLGDRVPEEKAAAKVPAEDVSPFEEVPPSVSEPVPPRDVKPGAPSDPVIPVWATTPEPEEEPSREAALEADRPEPMVTTPVPRETVRRVRDREREAQPEEEAPAAPPREPVPQLVEDKNPELEPVVIYRRAEQQEKSAPKAAEKRQPVKTPAVQYGVNVERERKIAEKIRRRKRRPVIVILTLCALLVVAALIVNAMQKDRTPSPTPSPAAPSAAPVEPVPVQPEPSAAPEGIHLSGLC